MLLGTNHSTYTLNFEPDSGSNIANSVDSSSIATAYLLDYDLMQSLLTLPSATSYEVSTSFNAHNLTLVSSDKTVYQDSFNNYLFNISTTTLSNNLSNYKYSNTKSSSFKFM
jgi:hypothetical protein